jgi:hypothetical protein
MYDCVEALLFVSTACLQKVIPHAGEEGYEETVAVTYLMDNAAAFQKATEALMLHIKYMSLGPACGDYIPPKQRFDPEGRLPERFWGKFSILIQSRIVRPVPQYS